MISTPATQTMRTTGTILGVGTLTGDPKVSRPRVCGRNRARGLHRRHSNDRRIGIGHADGHSGEKLHPDMPAFFHAAIDYYCDQNECYE
jgi:hypothetical protein